jgi:hypothetical protein
VAQLIVGLRSAPTLRKFCVGATSDGYFFSIEVLMAFGRSVDKRFTNSGVSTVCRLLLAVPERSRSIE